jgi:LPS export ABC transporter permease LptG/LPS export ABC transporter permease LptF
MKTLRRYIFFEILSPFFLGLLVFSFVLITRGSGKPLELLVQKNVTLKEVGQIFLYISPGILTFSIPMAVLLGILVCFGRLSADSEITAMRSGGVGIKNLLVPVIAFSTLAWLIALMNSNFWEPRANYRFKLMKNEIFLKSISTEVRPRVFEEGFYPLILFIQDISTESPPWNGIFLADVSNKNQPKITIARSGNLINDPYQRKLQLHLSDGAQHSVVNKTPESYQLITFQQSDIPAASISGPPENTQIKKISDMAIFELMHELGSSRATQASLLKEDREKYVEISRRFALPFSVFIFSILGVPLGVISRRGGKSYGFVISLAIFLVYYLLLFQGINFAKSGRISALLGPWLANIVFLLLGIYLLLIADRQIEWDRYVQQWSFDISQRLLRKLRKGEKLMTVKGLVAHLETKQRKIRTALPLILDKYVIIGFFRYFLLVLSAFILIFIIFTFFELLNDIVENRIPAGIIVNYFRYLLPQIIYYMIPFSVLVGVLVNFSILTRTSQIIAMKSSGISLYRLSASLLLVAIAISLFSFALQEYVMPISNQKQDALRATIKGKSPQTYYRPDRKWMMGEHSRIFNYNYFDEDRNLFGEVSIYEIDPVRYEMKRRIFANRAVWDGSNKAWIFEDGWSYGFESAHRAPRQFQKFSRAHFPEISEDPQYFKKEVKESSQMNYRELQEYIDDLSRSGFDVVKLTVALHKKLSFPLISVIMCMIAIPFSFSTGKRGSLYGIGLSIMIGVIYWIILGFFEQVGSAGKLLPLLAAWAPNLVFGASGIYLLFTIET